MNYVGLQNLYDGRSQYAAMTPDQPVTPRYQLLMGPWQHVTTGTGVNMSALELEWFDTWLLGEHTPMGTTTTPLHLNVRNAGDTWVDTAHWPLTAATPTPYYFAAGRSGTDAISQNDGDLTTQPPTDPAWGGTGADTILWSGTRARATSRRTSGAPERSPWASSPSAPPTPATSTTSRWAPARAR